MSQQYKDRTITCVDCNATFTFSAGEQAFYAEKKFENDPKRCRPCKEIKRDERDSRDERTSHPAVCAQCGVDCTVPFKPSSGKPVYCSKCFQARDPRA